MGWVTVITGVLSFGFAVFSWWHANASKKARAQAQQALAAAQAAADAAQSSAVSTQKIATEVAKQSTELESIATSVRKAPLTVRWVKGSTYVFTNTTGDTLTITEITAPTSFQQLKKGEYGNPFEETPFTVGPYSSFKGLLTWTQGSDCKVYVTIEGIDEPITMTLLG